MNFSMTTNLTFKKCILTLILFICTLFNSRISVPAVKGDEICDALGESLHQMEKNFEQLITNKDHDQDYPLYWEFASEGSLPKTNDIMDEVVIESATDATLENKKSKKPLGQIKMLSAFDKFPNAVLSKGSQSHAVTPTMKMAEYPIGSPPKGEVLINYKDGNYLVYDCIKVLTALLQSETKCSNSEWKVTIEFNERPLPNDPPIVTFHDKHSNQIGYQITNCKRCEKSEMFDSALKNCHRVFKTKEEIVLNLKPSKFVNKDSRDEIKRSNVRPTKVGGHPLNGLKNNEFNEWIVKAEKSLSIKHEGKSDVTGYLISASFKPKENLGIFALSNPYRLVFFTYKEKLGKNLSKNPWVRFSPSIQIKDGKAHFKSAILDLKGNGKKVSEHKHK